MNMFKVELPKLFLSSKVTDDEGDLMKVYHGTKSAFDTFDSKSTIDGGFHFGSASQAMVRGSGEGRRLVEVALDIRKPRRSKDQGGNWNAKIKSAKSAGFDGIVYLNRYEGISTETVTRAFDDGVDLDKLSDKEFSRFAPEAKDSWIAFEPGQIKILNGNADVSEISKLIEAELEMNASNSAQKKRANRP